MAPIMTIYYQYYASPVGQLLLLAKAEGLIAIEFAEEQATTDINTFMPANQTSGLANFASDSIRRYNQLWRNC